MTIVYIILALIILTLVVVMLFIIPRVDFKIRMDLMVRYGLVLIAILVCFALIIVRISEVMYIKGPQLRAFGQENIRVKHEIIPAHRGNILADNGAMLSSTLPYYRIEMDMRVEGLNAEALDENKHKAGKSYFEYYVAELADSLSTVFGEKPAKQIEKDLREAKRKGKRNFSLVKREVDYMELQRIKKFPILKRGSIQGGLQYKERTRRERPYHPLAFRTIGDMYAEDNTGMNGLELYYEKELCGKPGSKTNRYVGGKYIDIEDTAAVNGNDLLTTINIDLQEITYKALRDSLVAQRAECGTAVLMECATGNIKAIANLTRNSKGDYVEIKNIAFADQIEPGSTFKTISLMVALEQGKVDTTRRVDTAPGHYMFGKARMTDTHNNGTISMPDILAQSSNIGVSRIIDETYAKNPQEFIDGIHRIGLDQELDLEIPGHGHLVIKDHSDKTWARTTLPWTSIGYEVQVPPIYTLMFYNAIANGGKMVAPRLATALLSQGDTVRTLPVRVINESICQPSTLHKVQSMLERVVTHGTAKAAASELFPIAGKTGTSRIQAGGQAVTDENGRPLHNITFCGYFPADNPKYSCIVYIKRPQKSAAGRICGGVFRAIAERAYALQEEKSTVDKKTIRMGDERLRECMEDEKKRPQSDAPGIVPDLIGYTLRESLYCLENRGWKVETKGHGRIVAQSVSAGSYLAEGETILLTLQ